MNLNQNDAQFYNLISWRKLNSVNKKTQIEIGRVVRREEK